MNLKITKKEIIRIDNNNTVIITYAVLDAKRKIM